MDDLEPVPHAWHAAIVRSQLAHARVSVDATAARELEGVAGVVTGEDVARLSRPFPAAIDSPAPHYAAAVETARYVGEPLAVVVARDRYLAEDAAELVAVDYDPLDPVVDPTAAEPIHERRFHYGDVDDGLARAHLVVRTSFRVPRWTGLPVECYGVVCDWDEGAGRLTAWANFQGPFTLHGVAAAALGLRGDRLRLLTPPDSGGSFGVKAAVLGYVVLIGLASRALGVPVRWTEDRLEHLIGSSASTGRITEVEAGFAADGELVALRYDALEDVGAYVRAPEPATLYRMHGSLAGAYRVRNVATRNRVVLTNTMPSGLNRGFGGPQLYFGLERTMAIAARRLGLDPAELARRNLVRADEMPYRTPSGGLYDSGDYEACLDRALEASRYHELRSAAERARAEGKLMGVGLACVVEPSISNMGYITLAQTAVERAGTLPKSGNAEGASVAIDPLGGITVRLGDDATGPGAPHRRGPGRCRRSRLLPGGRLCPLRARHRDDAVDGRVGKLLVTFLGRRGGSRAGSCAKGAREGRRDPGAPRGAGGVAAEGRGHRALEPREPAGRHGARPCGDRVPLDAEPRPARRGGPRRVLRHAWLHRRRLRRRGRPRHGRGHRDGLRERPRRGDTPAPGTRRGTSAGRVRPRRRGGALRAARLRRGREPDHRLARRLRHAGRAGRPRASDSSTSSRRRRSRRSARKAWGRGRRCRPLSRSQTPLRTRSAETTSSYRSPRRASGS